MRAALDWASELLSAGTQIRRTSTQSVSTDTLPADFFAKCRETVKQHHHGLPAQTAVVECLEAACRLDYSAGADLNKQKYQALVKTTESTALRHMFFAERQAARVGGLPTATPSRDIASVGIVGAGTMGGGIAMSFTRSGFQVTLLKLDLKAQDRGLPVCPKNFERSAKSGRYTTDQVEQYMSHIRGSTFYTDLAEADLVIEVVFEDPDNK